MITLKQNDTGIGIKATLSNENGPVDLTGATVLFYMGEQKITANTLDAGIGSVLIVFNNHNTSQIGIYKAEFEVTFSDGRIETFPNDDYLQIKIMKEVD